ncbi:MAG: M48 family metallopeptidase [Halarcobacter sp.]
MNFIEEIFNKKIEIKVIKKRTTRHTYLGVKSENLIEISTNIFFTINDAKKLIDKKRDWLEKALKNFENKTLASNEYYYLGQKYEMQQLQIDIDFFYKQKAKEIIPKLVDKYSKLMGLYPTNLKYRKNKRTWGSCNYKNGLNFNILLMKFPLELVEYVVIHELAHIKYKNHSKRFWALVEKYCSDYKQREKLFKSFL